MNEPIRGQEASAFWDSEGSIIAYTAFTVTVYHCGKCGIALDQDHWPTICNKGHRNVKA